jgi:hypothetical protein
MPRPDSAESTGAIWWIPATIRPKMCPVTRYARETFCTDNYPGLLAQPDAP